MTDTVIRRPPPPPGFVPYGSEAPAAASAPTPASQLTRPAAPAGFVPYGSAAAAPAPAEAPGRGVLRTAGDLGLGLAEGAVSATTAIPQLANTLTGGAIDKYVWSPVTGAVDRALGGPGQGRTLAESAQDTRAAMDTLKSPQLRAAEQNLADTKGFIPSAKAILTSPMLLAQQVAEQVPQFITPAAAARKAGEVALAKVGSEALAKGTAKRVAAGSTEEAAKQAALPAAQRLGERAAGKAGARAVQVSAGAIGAGQASEQAQQAVLALPQATFDANPDYQRMRAAGMSDVDAKRALAQEAGLKAAAIAGPGDLLASGLTARLESNIFRGTTGVEGVRGVFSGKGAKGVATAAGREALEEGLQEGPSEQFAQNVGVHGVDPSHSLSDQVAEQAALGSSIGAVLGAGGFAGSAMLSHPGTRQQAPSEPAQDVPNPGAAPGTLSDAANTIVQTAKPAGPISRARDAGAAQAAAAPPTEPVSMTPRTPPASQAQPAAPAPVAAAVPPWVNTTTGEVTRPTKPELVGQLATYIQQQYMSAGHMRTDNKALAEAWGVTPKDIRNARGQATAIATRRIKQAERAAQGEQAQTIEPPADMFGEDAQAAMDARDDALAAQAAAGEEETDGNDSARSPEAGTPAAPVAADAGTTDAEPVADDNGGQRGVPAEPGAAVRADLAGAGNAGEPAAALTPEATSSSGEASAAAEPALPAGWSESRRGGMATSQAPDGGIVDVAPATGKWFAVPNKGGATLEGFDTRAQAIEALQAPATIQESLQVAPAAKPLPKAPKMPAAPYDMSADEISAHAEAVKQHGAALEAAVLGDKADAWRKAQRAQNSTNKATAAKASAEIGSIEAGLTQEQKDALYGVGGQNESFDNLEDFQQAHSDAQVASPDEAAETIASFLPTLGDTKGTDPSKWTRQQQVAYAGMREVRNRIEAEHWDSKDIQRQALLAAASKFADANDAEFMLKRFLPSTSEAPATQPKAKALPKPATDKRRLTVEPTQQTPPQGGVSASETEKPTYAASLPGPQKRGVAAAELAIHQGPDGKYRFSAGLMTNRGGFGRPVGHSESFSTSEEARAAALDEIEKHLPKKPDDATETKWAEKIRAFVTAERGKLSPTPTTPTDNGTAPRIEALGEKGLLVHGDAVATRAKLAEAGYKKKGRVQKGALRFDAKDRPAIEKALGLAPTPAVEAAAAEAATSPTNTLPEPTPAQHEAGNFKMGHVRLHGLDVTIEVAKGGKRRGIDKDGNDWERVAAFPYGHIRRTVGADGEHVDVYLGPLAEDPNAPVFVIDQVRPGTKEFDEHKVMMGFANAGKARAAYERNFPKGLKTFGGIRKMTLDEFKAWLKAKPTAPATAPIDDFGEKLGGARKDMTPSLSRELTDSAIASQPLSKTWPASELDAITDPFTKALAFAARAEIPAKPRKNYKLGRWVEQVKWLRKLAQQAVSGELTPELLAKNLGLTDFAAKVKLLQAIDRSQWSRVDEVREAPGAGSYVDGKFVPKPMVAVRVDGRWHYLEGASDLDKVMDKAKALFNTSAPERRLQFEIRKWRKPHKEGAYFINKKGDTERRSLHAFDNVEDAKAYLSDNHADLVQAWEALKADQNVTKADMRRTGNRERVGEDYRQGKDVTPESFAEAFGFRGVEFGNWVRQGKNARDRQGMLNQSYDALMDLAAIVGVPPRAMSLNGTLGLGLGSRGHGWASAHFEPDRLVINLTKTRGAGSLAHEWFHALDNYFARTRGEPVFNGNQAAFRQQAFVTYRPEPVFVLKDQPARRMTSAQLATARAANPNSKLYAADNWIPDPKHPEGVRPEVEKAFAELVQALNASPMAKRAARIDKGTSDGYWSRIIERAARSFENYVIVRMADRGIENDYLANVVTPEEFARADDRYPYLRPEEVGPVATAFDTLFNTVETRETEGGNVALFRFGTAPAGASAASVRHLRQVNAWAGELTGQWGDNQPRVRVVHSADMLPAEAKRNPRYRRAHGFYDNKQVWLVAPNLESRGAVAKTLTHEAVGHYGVDRIIEDELGEGAWGKVTASVEAMRAKVRVAHEANRADDRPVDEGLSRVQKVVAEVERRYGASTDATTFAEETLAVMSEKGVRNVWMDRVVTALRRWLRKIMPGLKLSGAELRQLLARSDRYLRATESHAARVARVQSMLFAQAPPIDSPEFQRYFKGSKVVDAEGAPLVVYHGTGEEFTVFNDTETGSATGHTTSPLGFFFTPSRAQAQRYAENASDGVPAEERVVDAYLAIRKPYAMTLDEAQAIESPDQARALRARLEKEGYDGIRMADADTWIAFHPGQIKSASGNTGAFDASNPDINFSLPEDHVRTGAFSDAAGTPASVWRNDRPLKRHADYAAAKAGDPAAAVRLVTDVAEPLLAHAKAWGSDVVYVAPHAEEAGGRNAIPQTLAAYLAQRTGGTDDTDIVQTNRAYHTGADAMQRLLARSTFAGTVTPGARYVLVDDVSTMGGTLADLADFIQSQGGAVVGSAVLVNASRAGTMKAAPALVRQLERRYGDEIRNQFHIDPAALTADEARYLIGFRSADELRNRAAAAAQARGERLRAKGVQTALNPDETPPPGGVSGSGAGNFSLPEASIDTMGKVLEQPDESAFQRAKGWLAGKWEDLKPATLGALQLRHLLELAGDHPALKGAAKYAGLVQRMDADRNVLLTGAPDAGEHPNDLLRRGVAPMAERWRKWAYKKGLPGLLGRKKPAAKALSDLMHDATIYGLDPAAEYERLTMADSRGNFEEWTQEKIRERIKELQGQMRGRAGDDKEMLMDEVKRLRGLPKREKLREERWPDLVRRYNALDAEAKQIYKDTRDWYRQHSDATEEALIDRIQMLDVPEAYRRSMVDRIRLQFESNRLQGVYFPLDRNGEYWLSMSDTTGAQGFKMFESARELEQAERKLRKAGFTIEATGRRAQDYRAKDAPSGTFVKDVIVMLQQAHASEKLQDDIYQMFLRTLPEMSMRKHQIHRRAVPGYSGDALRAFAKNGFHGAHQLARLRYSQRLQMMVEGMQASLDAYRGTDELGNSTKAEGLSAAKGDALLGELKKRHEWIMSPKDSQLANKLTGIGFVYYLGASPASALVNLTQGAQVTLPVLAAAHGWTKAGKVLASTTAAALRTGGNIQRVLKTDDERRAYRALEIRGDIDRTQAHTLAALAEGDQLAANPAWTKVLNGISWMFHKAEIVNREAAGIAAFRLARDAGKSFNEAVQYASDIINGTQFDYSAANRPRFMQGGTAKVLLQFKNYSVGMTWLMYRNLYQAFKGESPEIRRQARRTLTGVLGMTSLMAGVVGLPIINAIALVANAAHAATGDDDDPWDFMTEFRDWLAEHFGKTGADLIADGAVNQLGADVASRVSLSNLWFRDADRELEGRDAYYALLDSIAGPLGGITKNFYVGSQRVADGQVWRGVETMLPTFAKNGMKSLRYATQGVNTLRGDPIITDPSAAEDILQALGFRPTRLAEQQRVNSALYSYQQHIQDRRSSLMNAFALALRQEDNDARATVLAKIRAFNQKYPEIAVRPGNLRASLRARARYSQQATGGIALNRRLANRVRAEVGTYAQPTQ